MQHLLSRNDAQVMLIIKISYSQFVVCWGEDLKFITLQSLTNCCKI